MVNSRVRRQLLVLFAWSIVVGGRGVLSAQYREVPVVNGGSLRGRVTLSGGSHSAPGFPITKDDNVCGTTPSTSRLITGKDRGVRNAIVYLEKIDQGRPFPARRASTLDQRNCEFQPHVLLMRPDEPLTIVNNDRVLHNVHAYMVEGNSSTLFNIAQPIKGQKSIVAASSFQNARLVLVTCDAGHPWMSAYVVRLPHPYYAITDARGEFRLDDIPPGTYVLVMWHEGVAAVRTLKERGVPTRYFFEEPYQQSKSVVVAPHKETHVDFELNLR